MGWEVRKLQYLSVREHHCIQGAVTFPHPACSHEMETFTLKSRRLNLTSVTGLFDRLGQLPVPLFVGKQMKLLCITFKLGPLLVSRNKQERNFCAQTTLFGIVEIKTEEDLSRFSPLYLVHPWIDFLLDQQPMGSVVKMIPKEKTDDQSSTISKLALFPGASALQSWTAQFTSRFGLLFGSRRQDAASLLSPSTLAQSDKEMHTLRTLARLSQLFGVLLLIPSRDGVAAYRRVSAESLIKVQVQEITPAALDKLMDSVKALDML